MADDEVISLSRLEALLATVDEVEESLIRVKSKKPCQCEWCMGIIPQGEKHVRFIGTWEGEKQDWRMHEECFETYGNEPGDGFMSGQGEIPERIRDLVGVLPGDD